METDPDSIVAQLRQLVAEEMHLLGQELEDSLDSAESDRLAQLCASLDEATELLTEHRARGPGRR